MAGPITFGSGARSRVHSCDAQQAVARFFPGTSHRFIYDNNDQKRSSKYQKVSNGFAFHPYLISN